MPRSSTGRADECGCCLSTQAELLRGKNHAQKSTTPDEFLLLLAADMNQNTTINHANTCTHVLGVCLCNSGWIGQLWLSQHHISSAAHSVCVFTWLIVMNRIFSCCTCPMKLKLSHVKRIGIGQPRMCLLFGLQMCSGR